MQTRGRSHDRSADADASIRMRRRLMKRSLLKLPSGCAKEMSATLRDESINTSIFDDDYAALPQPRFSTYNEALPRRIKFELLSQRRAIFQYRYCFLLYRRRFSIFRHRSLFICDVRSTLSPSLCCPALAAAAASALSEGAHASIGRPARFGKRFQER